MMRLRKAGIHNITLHRDDFVTTRDTCPDTGKIIVNNPFDNVLELAGVPSKQRDQVSAFKLTFTSIDYEISAEGKN
jgi:hypothetical protein